MQVHLHLLCGGAWEPGAARSPCLQGSIIQTEQHDGGEGEAVDTHKLPRKGESSEVPRKDKTQASTSPSPHLNRLQHPQNT